MTFVLLAPSAQAENIPLFVNGITVADKVYDGTTDANLVFRMLPTEPIASAVTPVANADATVYTNGFVSADGTVWSNRAAKVVYTAKKGCCFADGTSEKTVALDTTVDPAVVAAGEVVPDPAGKTTLSLGIVAQRYPWNGTVDVGYKATFWPAGKQGAIEVTVGESVTTNDLGIADQGTVLGTATVKLPDETKGKATVKVVEE